MEENKVSIIAIQQHYKELIKKYPICKKEIDKFIEEKCKYYSKMNQETLEKFGFEKGRKFEYIQKIADNILLIDENYKSVDTSYEEFNFEEVYEKIIDILKYYCDLRKDFYPLVTLWIIGTHFHNCFSSYPYLFFNAMKGSGKSRLLNLMTYLCKDGDKLTSLTEAVLFRTQGTLCIDEFEGIGRKGGESLRELLNTAYKKGGKVKRMRKTKGIDGEKQVVEIFDVYRPIAIANIYGMENVLGDRCIELILERSNNQKIVKLVENFDRSSKIMEVRELFSKGSGRVGSYKEVFENTQDGWNNYINPPHSSSNSSTLSFFSLTSISSNNNNNNNNNIYNIYDKINKINIQGRDLELFLPLYLLAEKCGILNEILELSVEITNTKKEGDIYVNQDIQLFDFISQYPESNNFVKVSVLTNEFRTFIGSEDKDKFPNSNSVGQSLKRLGLIKEKKRSNGIWVILNIKKAQEKIKMFK